MGELWDKVIHLIPFDEAGWDLLKNAFKWFRGEKKEETEEGSKRRDPRDKLDETLEGVAAYWGNVQKKARKNLDKVLSGFPPEKQDAAEQALGRMLGQLKNGIFPATMQKVVEEVPYKVEKDGETYTVWKDKVTEEEKEKPGWDPGKLFIRALNKAGESEETAARFWEMMIQVSPFQRFIKALSEKTAGMPRFSSFLLRITRTKPRMKLKYTPRGKSAFNFKKETKRETITRAWNRLVVFGFLLLLLVFALAVIAIPLAAYKLAVGPMVAEGGMSGLVAGVVFWTILLLILSPVGFSALRVAGFTPARRKYFSVIIFLAVAGIATRVISQAVSLRNHPALAPVAIGALLILVWTNVYKRLSASDEHATRNGYAKLNGFVTVLLVLALVGMVFREQFPDPAMSWHRAKIEVEEFLGQTKDATRNDSLFTREGTPRWCRPSDPLPEVAVEPDWWMDFVYRCNGTEPGTEPGTDPKLRQPGRALSTDEAIRWYERKKELESSETAKVVRVSDSIAVVATLGDDHIVAPVGGWGVVKIPTYRGVNWRIGEHCVNIKWRESSRRRWSEPREDCPGQPFWGGPDNPKPHQVEELAFAGQRTPTIVRLEWE